MVLVLELVFSEVISFGILEKIVGVGMDELFCVLGWVIYEVFVFC